MAAKIHSTGWNTLNAKHVADRAERAESDLKPNAREEADQHGPGQEIRKKPQPEDSGKEKYARTNESNGARECDIFRCVGGE
jgi:hypothetical protein